MDDFTLYETNYGDTFDTIAFDFYDNPMLSSTIIEANPDYADVLIFDEIVTLKIPNLTEEEAAATLPPWRK